MTKSLTGVIHAQEAYSKTQAMLRLGISQRFWDKMINDGLPYAEVGHARWVTGRDLIEYMEKHAIRHTNGNREQNT
jgi:hypothetical protein